VEHRVNTAEGDRLSAGARRWSSASFETVLQQRMRARLQKKF
jgi:hypothetical protein